MVAESQSYIKMKRPPPLYGEIKAIIRCVLLIGLIAFISVEFPNWKKI